MPDDSMPTPFLTTVCFPALTNLLKIFRCLLAAQPSLWDEESSPLTIFKITFSPRITIRPSPLLSRASGRESPWGIVTGPFLHHIIEFVSTLRELNHVKSHDSPPHPQQ